MLFVQSTVKDNLFSKHDNRHTLQRYGEYFGQGLGKQRLKGCDQHRSDNHISWIGNQTTHYCSTYKQGYNTKHQRSQSAGPSYSRTDEYLLNKFHVVTKPNFRRFPRHHSLPPTIVRPKDLVSTSLWQPLSKQQDMCNTPLSVLASTQQPFLQHSRSWQYSYKP